MSSSVPQRTHDIQGIATIYYRVKGENLRLVFVVKIHGSPFTLEILLDS